MRPIHLVASEKRAKALLQTMQFIWLPGPSIFSGQRDLLHTPNNLIITDYVSHMASDYAYFTGILKDTVDCWCRHLFAYVNFFGDIVRAVITRGKRTSRYVGMLVASDDMKITNVGRETHCHRE